MKNINLNKGFVVQGIIAVIALILITTMAFYVAGNREDATNEGVGISITSPNGETVSVGDTLNISYSLMGDIKPEYHVALIAEPGYVPIDVIPASQTSYSWTIPDTMCLGGDACMPTQSGEYSIRAEVYSEETCVGFCLRNENAVVLAEGSSGVFMITNGIADMSIAKTGITEGKVYRDTVYGFEFSLPEMWSLSDESTKNLVIIKSTDNKEIVLRINGMNTGDASYIGLATISGNTWSIVERSNLNYSIFKDNTRYDWEVSKEDEASLQSILSTFKFTSLSGVSENTAPSITSITPISGPRGTIVEIKGTNLAGFEGDLIAMFTTPNGTNVELIDKTGTYAETQGRSMKIVVDSPCKKGETVYGLYSGIPSECNFVDFIPGKYKVKALAWGKESNVVEFTITN